MLKTLLNEALIELEIETKGPILIKSGMERLEEPDMFFVRTGNGEIYLPGSSLKGVIRSYAERITRTLSPEDKPACCDPFQKESSDIHLACSKRLEERKIADAKGAYKESCLICRLFGTTASAGRFSIEDASLKDGRYKIERRDGVGIDRFTGGASSGAKFMLEPITDASFSTQIYIRNFELWQLGLLAYVFQDFKDELIRIGYGKSRGLGKVKGVVKQVKLRYLGHKKPLPPNIWGIRKMMEEDYGFFAEENKDIPLDYALTLNPEGVLRHTYTFDTETTINKLWLTVTPIWNRRIESYLEERFLEGEDK